MPPASITARASETISWKWVEGSRRRNLRVIPSEVLGSVDLEKKRRPSFEGWVSAERSELIWCKAGVDDSGFEGNELGLIGCD